MGDRADAAAPRQDRDGIAIATPREGRVSVETSSAIEAVVSRRGTARPGTLEVPVKYYKKDSGLMSEPRQIEPKAGQKFENQVTDIR
jgi:hypothetical protein